MPKTVFAVMKCTIEIPVRASSPKETLEDLERIAKSEAEGILRNNLPKEFQVTGSVTFSHAVVREV